MLLVADREGYPSCDPFFISFLSRIAAERNYMNLNFNTHQTPIIIGIDHGYGNIKTSHCCFKTGVSRYEKEPTFKSNLLIHDGSYYLIGEEHKEFSADKILDPDYYILTLAAIARELNIRKETSARVHFEHLV